MLLGVEEHVLAWAGLSCMLDLALPGVLHSARQVFRHRQHTLDILAQQPCMVSCLTAVQAYAVWDL